MPKPLRQRKNKLHKQNKGFTLIELIVVIGILLTLSILAMVAYSSWQTEARKAAVSADANSVCRALNLYNSLAKTAKTGENPVDASGIVALKLTSDDISGITDKDMSVTVNVDRVADVNKVIVYDTANKIYKVDMTKLT